MNSAIWFKNAGAWKPAEANRGFWKIGKEQSTVRSGKPLNSSTPGSSTYLTLRPGSLMVLLSFGVLSLLYQGLLCNGARAGVCLCGGVRNFRADLVTATVKALLTASSRKWA